MQGLYAIVDLPHPHGLTAAVVTRAVLGDRLDGGDDGASVVQLRAKSATTEQRVAWLRSMAPLCRRASTWLVVNDDVDAAIEARVDGVHLGQDDAGADDPSEVRRRSAAAGHEGLKVGLSTHTLEQLRRAGRRRPDYLALGPIAPTRSKANAEPVVGWPTLVDGCRVASAPLVAIGGLDSRRGRHAIEAGAAAVAVIGALVFEQPPQIREQAIALARSFRAAAAALPVDEVHRRIPVLSVEQLVELARWGDSLGVHLGLGLPARFAPRVEDGRAMYRPCDVLDLLMAMDKRPRESWDDWLGRRRDDDGPLIQLRREV